MNKLAVVTGGSKGIGKAIVQRLAQEGFDIITCSRHEDELAAVKKAIDTTYPDITLDYQKVDLSIKKEVKDFANYILDHHQALEILVNNTGIFLPGESHNEEEGNLEKMIDTNLYSAYYLTRGIIEDMKRRTSGYIFNMCSIASLLAYKPGSSYSISKFALLGFNKVLREEMKPFGIRVSAILPGAVWTPAWEATDVPSERFVPASDIAEALYSAYSMSGNTVVEEILIRPQLGDI